MINIYHNCYIFYFVKIYLFNEINYYNYFNLSKEKNTLIQIKTLFVDE